MGVDRITFIYLNYDLCKQLSQKFYQNHLMKIEANNNSDPRSFWRYVNAIRKSYNLPSKMYYGDICSGNNTEIVAIILI